MAFIDPLDQQTGESRINLSSYLPGDFSPEVLRRHNGTEPEVTVAPSLMASGAVICPVRIMVWPPDEAPDTEQPQVLSRTLPRDLVLSIILVDEASGEETAQSVVVPLVAQNTARDVALALNAAAKTLDNVNSRLATEELNGNGFVVTPDEGFVVRNLLVRDDTPPDWGPIDVQFNVSGTGTSRVTFSAIYGPQKTEQRLVVQNARLGGQPLHLPSVTLTPGMWQSEVTRAVAEAWTGVKAGDYTISVVFDSNDVLLVSDNPGVLFDAGMSVSMVPLTAHQSVSVTQTRVGAVDSDVLLVFSGGPSDADFEFVWKNVTLTPLAGGTPIVVSDLRVPVKKGWTPQDIAEEYIRRNSNRSYVTPMLTGVDGDSVLLTKITLNRRIAFSTAIKEYDSGANLGPFSGVVETNGSTATLTMQGAAAPSPVLVAVKSVSLQTGVGAVTKVTEIDPVLVAAGTSGTASAVLIRGLLETALNGGTGLTGTFSVTLQDGNKLVIAHSAQDIALVDMQIAVTNEIEVDINGSNTTEARLVFSGGPAAEATPVRLATSTIQIDGLDLTVPAEPVNVTLPQGSAPADAVIQVMHALNRLQTSAGAEIEATVLGSTLILKAVGPGARVITFTPPLGGLIEGGADETITPVDMTLTAAVPTGASTAALTVGGGPAWPSTVLTIHDLGVGGTNLGAVAVPIVYGATATQAAAELAAAVNQNFVFTAAGVSASSSGAVVTLAADNGGLFSGGTTSVQQDSEVPDLGATPITGGITAGAGTATVTITMAGGPAVEGQTVQLNAVVLDSNYEEVIVPPVVLSGGDTLDEVVAAMVSAWNGITDTSNGSTNQLVLVAGAAGTGIITLTEAGGAAFLADMGLSV